MSLIPEKDGYYWMRNEVEFYSAPNYSTPRKKFVWRIVNVITSPILQERVVCLSPGGDVSDFWLKRWSGVKFIGPLQEPTDET